MGNEIWKKGKNCTRLSKLLNIQIIVTHTLTHLSTSTDWQARYCVTTWMMMMMVVVVVVVVMMMVVVMVVEVMMMMVVVVVVVVVVFVVISCNTQ